MTFAIVLQYKVLIIWLKTSKAKGIKGAVEYPWTIKVGSWGKHKR